MGVPKIRSHVRTSPVTISISDLLSKINPKDTDFLKYIPDGFLSAEQIEAKYKGKGIKVEHSDITELRSTQSLTQDQKAAQEIANKLGRKVVYENTYETQGFKSDGYIDKNGVIHIDYRTTNSVRFVLKHELTHYGEGSPLYDNFVKQVLKSKVFENWINRKVKGNGSIGSKRNAYRQQVIDRYTKAGKQLSPEKAQNEMIADFVGDELFTDNGSKLTTLLAHV